MRLAAYNFRAAIPNISLRTQQLDSNIAQREIAGVADGVGEVARRIADHWQASSLPCGARWGRHRSICTSGRHAQIGEVMPVKKGRFVRGNFDEEYAHVGIFEFEVMVVLLLHRKRRALGGLVRGLRGPLRQQWK